MSDYKKMYFALFNAMTDAIEILQNAQLKTEEIYESGKEAVLIVLPHADQKDEPPPE